MRRQAIVTVVTRNYAHFAEALVASARQHHPETDLFVCFADAPPVALEMAGAEVVYGSQLGIGQWKRFAFQYDPFELSCALKPFAMRHLLDRGYEKIVYLDSDMRVYGPLKEVFDGLDTHSLVLTPHLLRPFPPDGGHPGEDLFLMAGTFNAGFLALNNGPSGTQFLDWWGDHLKTQGHKDLAGSIFVDQKWLSLVPGLFQDVLILRNPGYNTGHWTLPQFELATRADGVPTIGEHPIVLFHFSNLTPGRLEEFSTCQNRMVLDNLPTLKHLVADYHQAVARGNRYHCDRWGCLYATLNDGTPIHPAWREAIRRNHPLLADIEDPFDVQGNSQLVPLYTSLERQARKWRKDWRLKGSPPEATGGSRSTKQRLKSLLFKIGLRQKAA